MGLLISIVNSTNHTKCVSLSNKKCIIRPTLINLHTNKYNREFHFYPFAVKLDKCVWSCNTLNDLSIKVCSTTQNRRFKFMYVQHDYGTNELKTFTKHIFVRM